MLDTFGASSLGPSGGSRRRIPDDTSPPPACAGAPSRAVRRRHEGERRGIMRRQVIGVAAGCVDRRRVLEPLVEVRAAERHPEIPMLVGVPKEIKDSEYRVGLVPSTVRELIASGHHVIVEAGAGLGAGLADADYQAVGAEIVADADAVYGRAELIVKVKEPLASERRGSCGPDRSCSPICIWRPTRSRLPIWSQRASSPSPMKP